MPNGILNDLEFEKQIQTMKDRPLLEFIARQTLEITQNCKIYDTKITTLENGSRKVSGIVGGISGTITAAIIGIINYFVNRS